MALGRAFIAEAPVCLMDEPLSNLDAQLRQEMRQEIRNLQRQLGITMVYVTHDQVEAMTMADGSSSCRAAASSRMALLSTFTKRRRTRSSRDSSERRR